MLNNSHNKFASVREHFFNIIGCISSGPGDLFCFSLDNNVETSSGEHVIDASSPLFMTNSNEGRLCRS